jgi:hypothetical protein
MRIKNKSKTKINVRKIKRKTIGKSIFKNHLWVFFFVGNFVFLISLIHHLVLSVKSAEYHQSKEDSKKFHIVTTERKEL